MFRESNGAAKMMVSVGSRVDDFISRDAAPVEILEMLMAFNPTGFIKRRFCQILHLLLLRIDLLFCLFFLLFFFIVLVRFFIPPKL